jgi:tetratricopeptide (TPR) repeat protein
MDHDDIQSGLEEANSLLEAGKPEETLACLTRIEEFVHEAEDRVEFAAMKAWALSDLDRHNEALDLLEPLVEEFPDSARIQGTLGVVLSNAGDLEPACAALEEAARLDDSDETTVANLALVYERMRQYDRSLELYEKAVDMGADIDWLLQRKAAVHSELGDADSAKKTLRRYLSLAPDDVNEWINLAILHSDDDEFEQAFVCYREAERIAPDSASLRLNWGVSSVRARNLPAARQQLAYLERLEPNSSRSHLLKAFILEEERQIEEAHREYETALNTVAPGDHAELTYALEMFIDFASRQAMKDRCESLFAAAYAANACTVELCEAYREATGEPAETATWFSLNVEADYRPGLHEVPDRDQQPDAKFTRYLRNFQVIAADRDDALAVVMSLLTRVGERGVSIREFVGEEAIEDAHTGIYEVERDALVYVPDPA